LNLMSAGYRLISFSIVPASATAISAMDKGSVSGHALASQEFHEYQSAASA
jgi:hypothetical protein